MKSKTKDNNENLLDEDAKRREKNLENKKKIYNIKGSIYFLKLKMKLLQNKMKVKMIQKIKNNKRKRTIINKRI